MLIRSIRGGKQMEHVFSFNKPVIVSRGLKYGDGFQCSGWKLFHDK